MKLRRILNEILSNDDNIPDEININGKNRPTKNSNGDYISKSINGIKNFYSWFGESKLVDNQNRPLVVYHGTGADTKFNKFNKSTFGTKMGSGVYFTSIESDARKYAARYGGGKVIEVYLKCEKLAVISNPFAKNELPSSYDSIRAFPNQSGEEIMVKEPEQIKAVDNNGDFSNDDNMFEYINI
jgi:hypothetical protein